MQQIKHYALKNASSYLQKLRIEKGSKHNFSSNTNNEAERTFEQCEIPSSKESIDRVQTKYNQEVDADQFNTGQGYRDPRNQLLKVNVNVSMEKEKQTIKIGLSDLIIQSHLKHTLEVYHQDLSQLQENRDNLISAIEDLGQKIQSLTELKDKNQILQLENLKNKKQTLDLMKYYHELKISLVKKKMKMQQGFNKKRDKIKNLMNSFGLDNEFVVSSESWENYLAHLKKNQICNNEETPNEKIVLAEVFPKIQQVPENIKKNQKGAKMIDKSSLLGDLKNFAKNFKMPNNSDI